MKYTYTFETTDAYIGLIQKVNNFLIQVFDVIKYVDKESPINENDYSITQDVQEDEVKMYFNMNTESKALKCLMSGIVDLLLDSIFSISFRSEEVEENKEDESDIFVPTNGKSIVKNIENYVTNCRPEPIAREGANQIAMVYTDIDKGDTNVYNRASVKQIVHKINERTKFEKYFTRLLSNIIGATMFPDSRERVKADIVPVKSLFVLETILMIKYGLGTTPIVATDKIIFTLFSKFDRKSTEPLVIEFKSMTDSTVYDITGDNAQPLNEPFSISISRLSSNECIATIMSLSDEINDSVCLPSLSAHLSISLSEKSFAMALFQYLAHVYFKRLEKGDDFMDESMLTE